MKKIGVLFGTEDTFPWALMDRINSMNAPDVHADMIKFDGVRMGEPTGYRVIIDRISHEIPFYRAAMKNAVIAGSFVVNNPFSSGVEDRFFSSALASKLGLAVPKAVALPHYQHPAGATEKSLRNLRYPLDWDALFAHVGFPAVLKPSGVRGSVYQVNSPEEFFKAYHNTGERSMMLQEAVTSEEFFRCYVVNQKLVHVMRYDPRQPEDLRYVLDGDPIAPALHGRLVRDCLVLCRAAGADLNAIEFAMRDGVPYAVDFLNPVPDADLQSVGPDNFRWVVGAVAEMAVEKALSDEKPLREYRWTAFLDQPLLTS